MWTRMLNWCACTPENCFTLQGKLEKEQEEMVRQGNIAPVEGHSDWVNELVIREKPNGSLRICLDPKDLNKAIKQEHHPVPTLDDITC